MHITGQEDGPPTKVGYAITDVLTGQHLTSGILAALLHKERTGKGQLVETNMLQSSLYSLSYVTGSYLNGNWDYTRMGNRHQMISPYSVYQTSDA